MDIRLLPPPTLSPSPTPSSSQTDRHNVQEWVSDEKLHEICIALCGGEDGRVALPDLPAILYQYEQTHNMSFVNSPSDKAVIEWSQKPEFADATLGLEDMKTIMRTIRGDMREIKTNKTESSDTPSSSDGAGDATSDRSERHRIIDTESDEGDTRSSSHRHAEGLPPVLSLSANGGRPSSPTVFHGRGPHGRTTSGSSRGRIRPPKPSGRRSASYDSADDVNGSFGGGFASGPSSRNVSGSSFHFPTTPEDALRPYDRAQSPPDVDVEDIDAYHVSSLDPIDERGRLLQLAPAGVATRSPSDEESPDRKVVKMEKQLAQSTKQTQVLQKRLEEAELVVSDMELKLIASDEQIVALTNEKNELRGKDRQRLQEVEQARQNTERLTEELEKTKQELEEKRAVLAEQIASNERLSDKLEEEKARIKDMELMADQEPTSPSSEPQLKEVIQKQSSHIAELENNSAHFDTFGDENLRLKREIDELKAELETRTPRRPRDRLAVESPIPSPGPATIRKEAHQESLSFAEGFDGSSPVSTPNPKMAAKARRPIPTRMLMSPSIKIGDMDGMDGSPDDLFTAVLRRRAKFGEGSSRGDPSDDGYVDEEEEEETGTVASDTDKAVEVPKGAVGGQPVPPEPRVRRPRSASMSAIDDSTLGIKNRSWVVVGIGAIALCMLVRTVWYGDTPNGWHPDDWNNWVTANSPHMAVHEGFVPYGYQQLNNIRPYFAPI